MADKRIPKTVVSDALTLSIPETARLLGTGLSTTRRLIGEGRLKALRLGSKCIRVPRVEIERFMAGEG